jgi:hypothetical protein
MVESIGDNTRPSTLEDKTILLRWNGKHNGNIFLNKIADILVENIKGTKVIKNWEVAAETGVSSLNPETSREFADTLASYEPDIVIGSQAD